MKEMTAGSESRKGGIRADVVRPALVGVALGAVICALALRASQTLGEALREAAPTAAPPGAGAAADNVEVKYSFSQQGEDIVIASIFRAIQIEKPSYLDIGAWDPVRGNNTFLSYLAGGRGVLVEPNPAYTARLQAVRPGDIVLAAGIGFGPEAESEADYYLVAHNDQLNTFSREQAEAVTRAAGASGPPRAMRMKLLNINHVIDTHLKGRAPDLLSVDVEGLDFEILQSLDFSRFRPAIICVETLVQGTQRQHSRTAELLEAQGYVVRGMTYVNTLFVDGRRLDADH